MHLNSQILILLFSIILCFIIIITVILFRDKSSQKHNLFKINLTLEEIKKGNYNLREDVGKNSEEIEEMNDFIEEIRLDMRETKAEIAETYKLLNEVKNNWKGEF